MLAYMMDMVEKSFKDMVYCILNIPEKSNYSAVLLELGLLKMKHFIQKLQLSYMNQLVWEIQGTVVCQAVLEEWTQKPAGTC